MHWKYQHSSSGLASESIDSSDCVFKRIKGLGQFKAFLQHLEPKVPIRIKHSEGEATWDG